MKRVEPGIEVGSQTYPRRCRLRKRWEFRRVQVEGDRAPRRDLIILWRRSATATSRLGVTVSRKVDKRATRRNRIKRWIREAFRRLEGRWIRPGLEVVVIARPSASQRDFRGIQGQVDRFWREHGPVFSRDG